MCALILVGIGIYVTVINSDCSSDYMYTRGQTAFQAPLHSHSMIVALSSCATTICQGLSLPPIPPAPASAQQNCTISSCNAAMSH